MSTPNLELFPAADAFWARYGRDEHTQLDFKVKADGIADTAVAMANAEGGTIVVGVSDKRQIVGVESAQGSMDRVTDAFQSAVIAVEPTVRAEIVNGRTVVIVQVPRQLHGLAQTANGRILRRSGSRDLPLTGEALMSFIQAQETASGEDVKIPAATAKALSARAVEAYLETRGTPRHVTQSNILGILVDLHLAERASGGKIIPFAAALLLFGRHPQDFLPRASVTFVRIPYGKGAQGPVRHSRREEITGSIPEMIERAYAVVFEEMRTHSVVRGLLREEVPEYPPPAVREAIVNALAHRDYRVRGSNVAITMWDDAIEVRSPGGLPAHVTVDNIRSEQYSRNPKVMEVLQRLRFVEQLGSGMDTIYNEMEQSLLQAPQLDAQDRSFGITFEQQSLLSFDDKLWLMQLRDLSLTVEERKILVLARHGNGITNADVRRLLSWDREAALRALRRLTDARLVELVGERGGSRYRLTGGLRGSSPESEVTRQRAVLDLISRTRAVQNVDVQRLLGVDRRGATRVLQPLIREGRVIQFGERRGTRYRLNRKMRRPR